MNVKKARHLFRGHFKELEKRSRRIAGKDDKEDIHKFRTCIKKMRSLLRLLSTALKDPDDLKFPKRFKDIYTICGKIRELQLQAAQTKPFHNYLRLVREEENEQRGRLKRLLKKEILNITKRHLLKHFPMKIRRDAVKEFIKGKIKKVGDLQLQPAFTDHEIHTVRKNLKDILYIEKQNGKQNLSIGQMELFKKMTERIGKFNDLRMALNYLRPGWITMTRQEERAELISLRNEINAQKDKDKHGLINEIKKLNLLVP